MFAVKGWNVDAKALKPQTEPFKSKKADDHDGEQKQGRKRKRGGDGADDVGKMWERHVEGKPARKRESGSAKRVTKKEAKRAKLEADQANNPNNIEVGERKPSRPVAAVEQAVDGGPSEEQTVQQTGAVPGEKVVKPLNEEKEKKKAEKKERKKAKKLQQEAKEAAKADPKAPQSKSQSREQSKEQSKDEAPKAAAPPVPKPPAGAKLTPMQAAMRQKLVSARFRHLNQTLYTEQSTKALELFDQNPEMFEDYHSGFRQQVTAWPENPVDNFIATIRARGKIRIQSQKKAFKGKKPSGDAAGSTEETAGKVAALPRTHGTAIVADLGCGDARLAQTLKTSNDMQNLQLKVLSYDLHSPSSLVTKADVSNLPTPDGSVDVAIFCLALMGTNWISFIEEAYRILHWKGELWVAEIKSRFGRVGRAGKPVEHSVGGKRKQAAMQKANEKKMKEKEEINEEQALAVEVDGVETQNQETDVSAFVDVLRRRGFVLKDGESSIDLGNKMFVKMEFIKMATPTKGKGKPEEGQGKPNNERFKKTKAKFLDEEKDEPVTDDEAKVLKPCLYKIR